MTQVIDKLPPRMMKGITLREEHYDYIRYPVQGSIKYDGVCVRFWGGRAYSPAGKEYRQPSLREFAALHCVKLHGFEGEFVIRDFTAAQTAGVLNRKERVDIEAATVHIFGRVDASLEDAYIKAIDAGVHEMPHETGRPKVNLVPHATVSSSAELRRFMALARERRCEGVMLRGGDGMTYKNGRATLKCQRLMKIKFLAECRVQLLDWEPILRNWNAPERDANGLQKRSSAQDGKELDESMAGTLLVKIIDGPYKDKALVVGARSLGEDLAREIAKDFGQFKGRILEMEYLGKGSEDKPRQPILKRFVDMI